MVNRWAKDNSHASQCINAKAETLDQRPTFSESFQQRRCILPADGFYERAGPKAKRQPLWLHPRAGGLLLFAGLYESWYSEENQPEVTFTIVTCAANAAIAEVHDLMPVVLNERAAEDWMSARARPAVTKTAARAGASRSARDAARLATRKQREKRQPGAARRCKLMNHKTPSASSPSLIRRTYFIADFQGRRFLSEFFAAQARTRNRRTGR